MNPLCQEVALGLFFFTVSQFFTNVTKAEGKINYALLIAYDMCTTLPNNVFFFSVFSG